MNQNKTGRPASQTGRYFKYAIANVDINKASDRE